MFAPIPMHSPAIGAGLELGVGYIFKLNQDDKVSPPSAIGAGALFTSNGTRGGALGVKLYLKEDLYRVTLAGGRARVNYDFFGTGIIAGNEGRFIPLTSRGTAIFGEMLRRVKGKIYVGGRVQYRQLSIAIRPQDGDSEGRPGIDEVELDARTVALGLKTTRDTRNDTFYPTRGSLFEFTSDFFDQAWVADSSIRFTKRISTVTSRWRLVMFLHIARWAALLMVAYRSTIFVCTER